MGTFEFMDADSDAYLLPQPEASGFTFNFIYQPVLTGPADAAEPYAYTLAFGEAGSLPADTAYTVADTDLAVEQTEYQDLGVELEGRQCDYPRAWEDQFFLFAQCVDRAVPSQATNLYSAESIQWDRTTEAGLFDADKALTEGFTSFDGDVVESAAVQSGWAEREQPQEITLALDSWEHTAESMGLEVSYDDGQTWTEAALDDDTTTLEHPDEAAFVSLRLTATDDAGTEVTHTTIRSFGLR